LGPSQEHFVEWIRLEVRRHRRELQKERFSRSLKFGNHKGASDKPDLLKELVAKDVIYGYAMALPLEKIE
jgi:hypothetical protein